MKWERARDAPHARLPSGAVLRITPRVDHEAGLCNLRVKEVHTLELLTDRGWAPLQSDYHYAGNRDDRESDLRRDYLVDGLKKYAEFLYGD